MTRVKFCGLSGLCDIDFANELRPEYIGFVFYAKSRRYVSPEQAEIFRENLAREILSVGVFVDEDLKIVAALANSGVIDMIQLHGCEDCEYILRLRELTGAKIIQAFKIRSSSDIFAANCSIADYVLLDAGTGTGRKFDWELVSGIRREYFLAGGLNPENISDAVRDLNPFAVDVSSGIESNGAKDFAKMREFISKVRCENE